MPFEFVDNNAAIDRAARRRIRSHVAMGRNAGKTLVRPSRKKAFRLRVQTATALTRIPKLVEDAHDFESNKKMVPEIERQVGDGLSVLSFPEQMTPRSRRLVQRGMYDHLQTENAHWVSSLIIVYYLALSFISGPRHAPELSNALDTLRNHTSMWVQFMFLDEACVYYLLAF
jgi:hypothetical protein